MENLLFRFRIKPITELLVLISFISEVDMHRQAIHGLFG